MFRCNVGRKYDDQDEEDRLLLRQAFVVPVIPKNFNPNVPPSSGEEFLQHVVFESRTSGALISKAQRMDSDTPDAPCSREVTWVKPKLVISPLAPTEAWENHQIDKFTKLRNTVHNRRMKNTSVFHISSVFLPDVDSSDHDWKAFLNAHRPLLSVVFALRQEQLDRALQVLSCFDSTETFQTGHGAWVYAVCACLEHPLSWQACGHLRDIARNYADQLLTNKNLGEKQLAMLNLIITLVVKYFNQTDLCDERL